MKAVQANTWLIQVTGVEIKGKNPQNVKGHLQSFTWMEKHIIHEKDVARVMNVT